MAEYYGKLKDFSNENKQKKTKKILIGIIFLIVGIMLVCVIIGIFGDTKRRDEARSIIRENSELKQQIEILTDKNEKLEKENENLKAIVENAELQTGNTLTKPNGDMSKNEAQEE